MNKLNVIGVDLAKNVIQVSVLSPSNRELRNSALTRRKFAEFLGRQRPSLVAFEACATSHYWARVAQRHGHAVKIIPAKAVFPFRQGRKTDENDALAVAEAARRPNVKLAPLKTVEQQGMQAIQRSRELIEGWEIASPLKSRIYTCVLCLIRNHSRTRRSPYTKRSLLIPLTRTRHFRSVFAIDIETSPDCGGKWRVIACSEDPPLICHILLYIERREVLLDGMARAPPDDRLQTISLT